MHLSFQTIVKTVKLDNGKRYIAHYSIRIRDFVIFLVREIYGRYNKCLIDWLILSLTKFIIDTIIVFESSYFVVLRNDN